MKIEVLKPKRFSNKASIGLIVNSHLLKLRKAMGILKNI